MTSTAHWKSIPEGHVYRDPKGSHWAQLIVTARRGDTILAECFRFGGGMETPVPGTLLPEWFARQVRSMHT